MPSGKSHDLITVLIAVPVFGAAYTVTGGALISTIVTLAFLFGGLMFGPDLDTKSKQYSRWGPFRLLWFPYKSVFKHRSRWSHGLVFGTLFRVVYFVGAVSIFLIGIAFLISTILATPTPDWQDSLKSWGSVGTYFNAELLVSLFAGMWAGAASHTFTDVAITYIKTGRVDRLL